MVVLSCGETSGGWRERQRLGVAPMDEILTARDVAEYLKLNDRTVLKLVAEGALPGVKVGGQWRFKRSVIDRWLDLRMVGTAEGDTNGLPEMPSVSGLLDDGSVAELDPSMGRDHVLSCLVARAVAKAMVRDQRSVTAALVAREAVCSTAIGGGVAFPHTRGLSTAEVSGPVIIIGRAVGGVDFDAMDREPTYLVILVCAPDTELQMRLMGRLSCLLRCQETVSALRQAETHGDVLRILSEAENELFGGRQTSRSA